MGDCYAERRGALRRKVVYALVVLGPSTASQLSHWMNTHYRSSASSIEVSQIIAHDAELRELIGTEKITGTGHAGNGTRPTRYSLRGAGAKP